MIEEIDNNKTYFLLPLKDLVMFPDAVTGVMVGREKSINALKKIKGDDGKIFVVAQKRADDNNINAKTLYQTGVVCKIIQQSEAKDEKSPRRIIIEGIKRARINNIVETDDVYIANVTEVVEYSDDILEEEENERIKKLAISKFKDYFSNVNKNALDFFLSLDMFKGVYEMLFYATSVINSITLTDKQTLLELPTNKSRLEWFVQMLDIEISLMQIDKSINKKVDKKLMVSQRKYYLNAKLKEIKKELGEDEEEDDTGEVGALRKKLKIAKLPKEAEDKVKEEIKKLEKIPSFASEYHVMKNYVDLLLELPWNKSTKTDTDLKKAEDVLNRDHYGLEKIKERILEFLAIYQRKKQLPGQIICFVGPPGVGKTSLVKSIAESLGRKYVKISLGGVHDEAEIRGHRKTYVGAMPGKIMSSIKKIGVNNPVILLDEIDKMGQDYRSDPTSALLEVLDPEQNKKFADHYVEVEFDLSNAMFITTANNITNIPVPLRDRMEVIKIAGYTEDEKLQIAKNYLIQKELELHGVNKDEFEIGDNVIIDIVRKYTFEAGVRNLEREIAKLIRKSLMKILTNNKIKKIKITEKNLKDYLGVEKFDYNKVDKEDKIGVSVGLAYTDFGGDLLNIETLKFSGNGKLITTGKLGDVMKESAQAAFSYVRSIADRFNIKAKEFNKYDFHLHVPEGATPKDGPSAGVAITASILSSLIEHKINKDVAMTGEISLTGKVMPIGGLKEKLLAALRGNIKTVVIPKDNEKNLDEIPEIVKKGLKIIPVDNLDDALKIIVKECNWN
ncbi:MAG: endopeptidase La [Rickettsiales bacterium]|jgi:ATP-dependent Lon protease|nr:endopeptidase La [Rickettsiales bacterium]